jgi:hypothetical protein
MRLHLIVVNVLLASSAIAMRAEAEEPGQVRPSTGTFAELRKVSTDVANTLGESLDKGHDWIYRRLQHWLVNIDTQFTESERTPIVVPLSPLRIGLDGEFLNEQGGLAFVARPVLEATLQLPNLQRRFKVFISSTDLPESPGDPALESNPLLVGARFAPRTHIDFDIGVRVKLWPSAFAALRWAPEFDPGTIRVYPFLKTYVESGLGVGVSGGVTLERWRGLWIARSATYGNWVHNTAATDWTQTFLVGHARAVIQERRYDRLAAGHDLACGTVALVTLAGDRVSHTSSYEASVLFKRPLHGGWLYGYFQPVVRWEHASDWHPDAGIRIGFDALFWGLADTPATVATTCR